MLSFPSLWKLFLKCFDYCYYDVFTFCRFLFRYDFISPSAVFEKERKKFEAITRVEKFLVFAAFSNEFANSFPWQCFLVQWPKTNYDPGLILRKRVYYFENLCSLDGFKRSSLRLKCIILLSLRKWSMIFQLSFWITFSDKRHCTIMGSVINIYRNNFYSGFSFSRKLKNRKWKKKSISRLSRKMLYGKKQKFVSKNVLQKTVIKSCC